MSNLLLHLSLPVEPPLVNGHQDFNKEDCGLLLWLWYPFSCTDQCTLFKSCFWNWSWIMFWNFWLIDFSPTISKFLDLYSDYKLWIYRFDVNTWISCVRPADWNECVWSSYRTAIWTMTSAICWFDQCSTSWAPSFPTLNWSLVCEKVHDNPFGDGYLVNKPLSAAGISKDNGWKIVWKMNSWQRSENSRATVKLWR